MSFTAGTVTVRCPACGQQAETLPIEVVDMRIAGWPFVHPQIVATLKPDARISHRCAASS